VALQSGMPAVLRVAAVLCLRARGETSASIDAEATSVVIPANAGTQAGFPLSGT